MASDPPWDPVAGRLQESKRTGASQTLRGPGPKVGLTVTDPLRERRVGAASMTVTASSL